LARIRAEDGFFPAVVSEKGPWLARMADVRNAVLQNALDPKCQDQAGWIKRYAAMLGVELNW
jgi:hypothetical protein